MQALIIDDDSRRQTELSIAFIRAGFQPTATGNHAVAEACIRRGWVDLLVMSERVAGRLTHSHALLAEWRNPLVATILLTTRSDRDVEELYGLLPSLHCLLAPDTTPQLITKCAVASVIGATRQLPPMVLTPSLRVGETVAATPISASTRHAASECSDIRRYG